MRVNVTKHQRAYPGEPNPEETTLGRLAQTRILDVDSDCGALEYESAKIRQIAEVMAKTLELLAEKGILSLDQVVGEILPGDYRVLKVEVTE